MAGIRTAVLDLEVSETRLFCSVRCAREHGATGKYAKVAVPRDWTHCTGCNKPLN